MTMSKSMANGDDPFSRAMRELGEGIIDDTELGRPFVDLFPVDGATISTLGDLLGSETIFASDARAARLDELQFDLGIGPSWDAFRSARPVIEPSLGERAEAVWPVLTDAVVAEGVSSLFAFPMIVGSLRIGAVEMYSRAATTLDPLQSAQAALLAEVVGRHVLKRALVRLAVDGAEEPPGPFSRRLIHQASGMVLAQLDVSAEDARLLIQGHAFSSGRSMMEVSRDVVEGVLDFAADDAERGASE